jgi:hypothetical protein
MAQSGTHRSDCAFGFTSNKDWQMRNEKIRSQLPIVTFLGGHAQSGHDDSGHRLNLEVDLQSLFGFHVTWCAQLFIGWDPATPPLPPHLDSYYEGAIGPQR